MSRVVTYEELISQRNTALEEQRKALYSFANSIEKLKKLNVILERYKAAFGNDKKYSEVISNIESQVKVLVEISNGELGVEHWEEKFEKYLEEYNGNVVEVVE